LCFSSPESAALKYSKRGKKAPEEGKIMVADDCFCHLISPVENCHRAGLVLLSGASGSFDFICSRS